MYSQQNTQIFVPLTEILDIANFVFIWLEPASTAWTVHQGMSCLRSHVRLLIKHRTWHIPAGRVSQRIQAFQDESRSSPVRSRDARHPPTVFERTPQVSEVPIPEPKTPQEPELEEPEQPHVEDFGISQTEESEAHTEEDEDLVIETPKQEDDDRGRPAQRAPSPSPEPSNLQDVDEVLEDVRARLYSVQ